MFSHWCLCALLDPKLSSLLSLLPSTSLTQRSTASCDINGLSYLAKRYPPKGVQFSEVSRSGLTYTWSVAGQEYGNGQYVAQASSVYKPGTAEEWPASAAFDHQKGASNKKSGWHVTSDGKSDSWLTLELPEPIRLDYYTISSRSDCDNDCAKQQSPTSWDLFCVEDPGFFLDTRTGQSFGANECRIYPAKTRNGTPCKTFKWRGRFVSMSELALYGIPFKPPTTGYPSPKPSTLNLNVNTNPNPNPKPEPYT